MLLLVQAMDVMGDGWWKGGFRRRMNTYYRVPLFSCLLSRHSFVSRRLVAEPENAEFRQPRLSWQPTGFRHQRRPRMDRFALAGYKRGGVSETGQRDAVIGIE